MSHSRLVRHDTERRQAGGRVTTKSSVWWCLTLHLAVVPHSSLPLPWDANFLLPPSLPPIPISLYPSWHWHWGCPVARLMILCQVNPLNPVASVGLFPLLFLHQSHSTTYHTPVVYIILLSLLGRESILSSLKLSLGLETPKSLRLNKGPDDAASWQQIHCHIFFLPPV